MTTAVKGSLTCGLCGAMVDTTVILSTNSYGPPDLDLRPAPMARDLIEYGVDFCRSCNYASTDIAHPEPGDQDAVSSEEYAKLLQEPSPELAKHYACAAYILEHRTSPQATGLVWLTAAWACDDAQAEDAAHRYRNEAAKRLEIASTSAELDRDSRISVILSLIDIYRRTGRFDEASRLCHTMLLGSTDERLSGILRLQLELIANGDRLAHTVTPTTEDPQRKAFEDAWRARFSTLGDTRDHPLETLDE